jgi:hypothetical protein
MRGQPMPDTSRDPDDGATQTRPAPLGMIDNRKPCPVCVEPMDWEDCDACGGDGEVDGWDEWTMTDEKETCHQCDGAGGWDACPNTKNHAHLAPTAAADAHEGGSR